MEVEREADSGGSFSQGKSGSADKASASAGDASLGLRNTNDRPETNNLMLSTD